MSKKHPTFREKLHVDRLKFEKELRQLNAIKEPSLDVFKRKATLRSELVYIHRARQDAEREHPNRMKRKAKREEARYLARVVGTLPDKPKKTPTDFGYTIYLWAAKQKKERKHMPTYFNLDWQDVFNPFKLSDVRMTNVCCVSHDNEDHLFIPATLTSAVMMLGLQ